jgi:DNA gyrase subunit A
MAKEKQTKPEPEESQNPMVSIGNVIEQSLEEEMQTAYLDYAMSVIVGRALPDIRDGLKPVHRRILYSMWQTGLRSGAKFKKCATVVGDVLGKYHPHGDSAVYESLVRMAQDFSLRYPLVFGQGNFGCFTKETKVRLTDGRDVDFETLVREQAEGKQNFTYTVNSKGLIAIAEIQHPRRTRENAELVKVSLDNGEEIRCTPNHRFMLRDGSYLEAQHLQSGQSLMPFYTRLSEQTDRVNREGYLLVLQNATQEWIPAHHLADNYNLTNHFQLNPDLVLQALNGNHKVVRVERLTEYEDVYDLTIEGTHNFCLAAGIFVHNSIDGDGAAAYRYTEAKLKQITEELLSDIEKNTVDFSPNFDGTHKEPRVLPAKLPNLIINGTLGIAVGMASNIPPHNLGEVCSAALHLIKNKDASVDELSDIVLGPDFPTGGIIYNVKDIKQAFSTGKGGVVVRAKTEIVENKKGDFVIIVKEIPYQVNKANLLMKIAELVREKKVEGIRDLRDESSKGDVRIVIELKKDAYPKKVLNRLFQTTQLQETFHYNMLALVDGIQPRVLNLKMILEEYIKHRREVVRRRTQFDLDRARERAHILEGLRLAILKIDQVIETIKKSKDKDEARDNLIKKFKLSEVQSVAILEMRLQQLANLERLKVEQEHKEKIGFIKELEEILASEKRMLGVIAKEIEEMKVKYGDARRTNIVKQGIKEFSIEDVVPDTPTVVMITEAGYIKRVPPDLFKTQKRGGKGVAGLTTKEEDVVEQVFSTTTHKELLFFTTRGRVFRLKAYDVPEASRIAKGQALVNFLQLAPGESVSATYAMDDIGNAKHLLMVTNKGTVKKTNIGEFENIRHSGLIAIKLKDGDNLQWVRPTTGSDDVVLVTTQGQAIRFSEKNVRSMGRVASGVRGIRLKSQDQVVGMGVLPSGSTKKIGQVELLVLMSHGYGKRTDLIEYKVQGRGGSGIKTANITKKTGAIVSAHIVATNDPRDLFVVSSAGQVVRSLLSSVSTLGRATQGVRVMRFKKENDTVASVALI